MRITAFLATLALAGLVAATPVAAIGGPDLGKPPVSQGSPCLNGGVNLYVFGMTVLQCWKPQDAVGDVTGTPILGCASEVCTLINTVCTLATKPVTKQDCHLVG